MKGIYLALTLSACALFAGCAGSGDNTSRFEGNYHGTYHSTNVVDDGTVDLSVDQCGGITGAIVANSDGSTADLTGSIADNGDITGDFDTGATADPFGGNLDFDNAGDLTGPINVTTANAPNGVERMNWDLTQTNKRATRVAKVRPHLGSKSHW